MFRQSCKEDVKFMATRCANAESYGMLISVQEIIRARGGHNDGEQIG